MSHQQSSSARNESVKDEVYPQSGVSQHAPQWNPMVPFSTAAPNQYNAGPPNEQFLVNMPPQSCQQYSRFGDAPSRLCDGMTSMSYPVGDGHISNHGAISNPYHTAVTGYASVMVTDEATGLQSIEASYGSFQPIPMVQNAPSVPFLGNNSPGPESPFTSSEYPASSNRTSLLSSIHMSPVTSPGMSSPQRSSLMRTLSRGKATPSPKPGSRASPYSVDNRSKRWSTGSYAGYQQPDPSFIPHSAPTGYPYDAANQPAQHGTIYMPHDSGLLSTPHFQPQLQTPSTLIGIPPANVLPSNGYATTYDEGQQPIPFQPPGFRTLESNASHHDSTHHFSDLSDPPNLLSPLHEQQERPPDCDMSPSDPNMIPHEQELRFANDLYTPRWVRGQGNKREGWCGICKPGRWLVLKNSAFWYDKSFSHGISASTGQPFQEPTELRRMDGSPNVWEGACGGCGEWIALVSGPRKGTTWFRHAYKCHSHMKVKDVQKKKKGEMMLSPGSGMHQNLAPRGG